MTCGGAKDTVSIIAVLVLNFPEIMPVAHEPGIRLGPAFDCARLTASGPVGHLIGQDPEEFFSQLTAAKARGQSKTLYSYSKKPWKALGSDLNGPIVSW